MKEMTYDVTTTHPAQYRDGTHRLTVKENRDGSRFVHGAGFGCSRDYHTPNALVAISMFLREHAMTVTKTVFVTGK